MYYILGHAKCSSQVDANGINSEQRKKEQYKRHPNTLVFIQAREKMCCSIVKVYYLINILGHIHMFVRSN